MANNDNNVSHWNITWIVGLVIAGIILFMAQRAISLDGRVQVLENEKTYLMQRLDRIESKIDRIEDKVGKIDRKTGSL